MKIAVVTSEVTFVAENYNQFLDNLFSNSRNFEINLIVLKNNSPKLFLKGIGLILMGAKTIGINLIKNSLKALGRDHQKVAAKYYISTSYYPSANDPNFLTFVKDNQIDLIVNARTRDIYKKKILKSTRLGCINIHHGILPEYRGTMCDLFALYSEKPAGFSIHKMESKIDDGVILLTKSVTDKNSKDAMNFPMHIYNSSKIEGIEMSKILKIIKDTNQLPIERENISSRVTYTKNPNYSMIREMKRKGMVL
jgi:folate-dependent phosphoribosylglycinamide formyltransferase PurN